MHNDEKDAIRGRKILLRFTPEPQDEDQKLMDDEAEEYIIVEEPKANSGLVVFGRYNRSGWIANPTLRPVVKYLLQALESSQMKCFHCGKPATKLCDFTIGYAIKEYENGHPCVDIHKRFTCDRPLCDDCATNEGMIFFSGAMGGPDTIDHCKEHAHAESWVNPLPEKDLQALQRRLQIQPVRLEEQQQRIVELNKQLQAWKDFAAKIGEMIETVYMKGVYEGNGLSCELEPILALNGPNDKPCIEDEPC